MKHVALSTLGLAILFATPAAANENRTANGVLAASREWSIAELSGDVPGVDQLLLDGYVTVDPDGISRGKQVPLANVGKRKGADRAAAIRSYEDYRAAHPYTTKVELFGDTAVLSYLVTLQDGRIAVRSSDVFVYRAGRWHGAYSQHSSLPA